LSINSIALAVEGFVEIFPQKAPEPQNTIGQSEQLKNADFEETALLAERRVFRGI
jgi:hypothetical protein